MRFLEVVEWSGAVDLRRKPAASTFSADRDSLPPYPCSWCSLVIAPGPRTTQPAPLGYNTSTRLLLLLVRPWHR